MQHQPIDPAGPSGATSAQAFASAPTGGTSIGGEDWPARLTDTIVGYVQTVRAATTGRALVASRMLVYFLAAGLIGTVLAVLATVMVFRLLALLAQDNIWLVYLGFGVVFTAAGLFAWAQKERSPRR